MKLKLWTLLMIAVAFSFTALAQSNYQNGYVIKLNGDTVIGYLNYKDRENTPKTVQYKANLKDKLIIQFSTKDIQFFKFRGAETYVRYVGPLSLDQTTFPNLPVGLDSTTKHDTIFLKQIAAGKKATLYTFVDDIKQRFFIKETESDYPIELVYHEYYNSDKSKVLKDYKYKLQLNSIIAKSLQENLDLIDRLDQLNYNQTDLENFVKALNRKELSGKEIEGFSTTSGIRFFTGLGLNRSITKFNGELDLSMSTVKPAYSPVLNFGFDLLNHKSVQKIVLRAEASLWYIDSHFNAPSRYSALSPIYRNSLDLYHLQQYSFTISPQILYNVYDKKRFKFYLATGFNANFSTYKQNDHLLINSSDNNIYFALNEIKFKRIWVSIPIKAGFVLNQKIDFSVKYQTPSNMTWYTSASLKSNIINTSLNYLF